MIQELEGFTYDEMISALMVPLPFTQMDEVENDDYAEMEILIEQASEELGCTMRRAQS